MRLIINADDFGMSRGCNYGIIDSHKYGILNRTSVMVNMPHAKHAATLAKDFPELKVGLHLNLTMGPPLTKCALIVNDKGEMHKGNLGLKSQESLKEFTKEIKRQFECFHTIFGYSPNHIDSHHFVDQIPGISEVIDSISREHSIKRRRFLNENVEVSSESDLIGPSIILLDTVELEEQFDYIVEKVKYSKNNFELVIHPAYIDNDIMKGSSLVEQRLYDLELASDSRLEKYTDCAQESFIKD